MKILEKEENLTQEKKNEQERHKEAMERIQQQHMMAVKYWTEKGKEIEDKIAEATAKYDESLEKLNLGINAGVTNAKIVDEQAVSAASSKPTEEGFFLTKELFNDAEVMKAYGVECDKTVAILPEGEKKKEEAWHLMSRYAVHLHQKAVQAEKDKKEAAAAAATAAAEPGTWAHSYTSTPGGQETDAILRH